MELKQKLDQSVNAFKSKKEDLVDHKDTKKLKKLKRHEEEAVRPISS